MELSLSFGLGKGETEGKEKVYDVVIIGGGPAGLSAAIYAARERLSTLVVDKNPSAGALGMAGKIENYPGVDAITGLELLEKFRTQAETFGAKIIQDQVIGTDLKGQIKVVRGAEGIYKARTVIIATGAMGRSPSLPGEGQFIGKGVSYCAVCDAAFFRDATVAVVGSGAETVEESHTLAKFAKKIYFITQGSKLKADLLSALEMHDNITIMEGYAITEIIGDKQVNAVRVRGPDGKDDVVEVRGVFVYLTGNKPITDFLQDSIKIEEDGCLLINHDDMSLSIEGVFAAGDVTCRNIRQVSIAVGEGCIAALSAERYINERPLPKAQWH